MVKKHQLPEMIDYYRKQNDWTLEELGIKLDKSKSAISRWISGQRSPMLSDLEKLADVFNIDVQTLLYGKKRVSVHPVTAQLIAHIKSASIPEQERLLSFAKTISVAIQTHNQTVQEKKSGKVSLFPVTYTEAAAAGVGHTYTDNETFTAYTSRDDLKPHDFATKVSGDSMLPTYQDGDILLVSTNTTHTDGFIYVVDYDGKSFVKKVYFSKDSLRLVSLNPAYDDILIPLNSDHYLNIVGRVVDSFTPETI